MKYECGYCKKVYNTIVERMECEANCLRKNKETKRNAEISAVETTLNNLREEESSLIAKLQTVRNAVCNNEKKLRALNHICTCGETQRKECDCKSHNTYEINGSKVSKDEFFNELNNLFGGLFN